MVRFIIKKCGIWGNILHRFTFHYGQIYYLSFCLYFGLKHCIYIPLWLDLLFFFRFCNNGIRIYLHSTMVRFIIFYNNLVILMLLLFTFHYGQIYYRCCSIYACIWIAIYIPLWLDLLFVTPLSLEVGFLLFTFHYGQIYYDYVVRYIIINFFIYIPLWLDLLFADIHVTTREVQIFTFHYGQIYQTTCLLYF